MIFIKKIGWIFLFLIFVLIGICTFLLNTSIGMHLICVGVTYFVPGLTFHSVFGNWKNFNINYIEYHIPIGIIKINRCDVILNYKSIFNKKMCVDYFFAEGIFINAYQVNTIKEKIKKNNLIQMNNFFSFLKFLIFKHIILSNVHIVSNNFILELKKIENMGVVLHKNNLLTILSTHVKGVFLNIVTANIFNTPVKATRFYRYYNLWGVKNILKILSNELLITLPHFDISLGLLIKEIKGQDFYIFGINDYKYKIDNFFLKASLFDQELNMHLDINSLYGCLNTISCVIFKENWPVNVTANYIIFNSNKNNNNIDQNINKVHLDISGSLFNEICLCCSFLNAISTVNMLLKTKIMQRGIPINIHIFGINIPFSYLEKNKYVIERFDFYLNGEMRNYYVQIISKLRNFQDLLVHIIMNAQGNYSGCTISGLKIKALNMFFELKGSVNWVNIISWNNVLILHKINILQKFFKYPIELSGTAIFQGCLYADTWTAMISNINIKGHVRNSRILCTGALYKNIIGQWIVPELSVRWGSNMLTMKGELKKNYNFDLILKVPHCNSIVPMLHGSVYSIFKARGSIKSPVLLSQVDIHSLRWSNKNFFINRLIFNSKIHCDSNISSDFFLQMNIKRCNSLLLYKLISKGQGNIKQHNVNIILHCNKKYCGELNFFGNFDFFRKIWSGKIHKMNIITPTETWKLSKNVGFLYQHIGRKITVDTHFWESINCCIPVYNVYKTNVLKRINTIFKYYNTMPVQTDFSIKEIDVHMIRIHCMDCFWIAGDKLPQGTILLSGTQLRIKSSNGIEIISRQLNNINMKVILKKSDICCQWDSAITSDSYTNGMFKINYLCNKPEILGNIYIYNVSLEFFSSLLFQSERCVQGLLNVNLRIFGSTNIPEIYGVIQLQNMKINKYYIPISIKSNRLLINFFKDHAVLNGVIETDHKRFVFLNGNIIHINSIYNMKIFLTIEGNQIDFCLSPGIRLKISPNIVCIINARTVCIRGKIDIPWARITAPRDFLKNTVDISSEEIILDSNLNPILVDSKNLSIFTFSEISISLGEDVNFNGFGLHIKLKGNIVAGYGKNGFMLTGHVDIPSGFCSIYGHHLVIKKGQLLFYGTLNQPYLDIEAIRDSSSATDETIMGVRITGMINQLKVEIFPSTSSFSQREIISYLLGSHAMISSYTDTNVITSLLIGMSTSHVEKFINRIGKIVGVRNLTLNTQNVGTTPLVVLSGFIAPGLQIKYGIGIFDLSTTITMRYCLSSQFYLEATSGNYQALDLLYRFGF